MNNILGEQNELLLSDLAKSGFRSILISYSAKHTGNEYLLYLCGNIIETDNVKNSPYLLLLDLGDESISIDQIREIKRFTKLKIASENTAQKRVIAVSNADKMTIEAQNALLKILEEPPDNTYIVLSSCNIDKLLSTIKSRALTVDIKPPSKQEAVDYFTGKGYDDNQINLAVSLTSGFYSEIQNYLEEEDQEAFTLAKKILTSKLFDKLVIVDFLSKDKQLLTRTLDAIEKTLMYALDKTNVKEKQVKLLQNARLTIEAKKYAEQNVNSKLLLINLFTQM